MPSTDQPNGGREQNCVYIDGFGGDYGEWWDISCFIRIAYICSKPSSGEKYVFCLIHHNTYILIYKVWINIHANGKVTCNVFDNFL